MSVNEEQLKANREYTTSCVIQITSQFTVSLPHSHMGHKVQGGVVTNSESPPSTSEGRKVRRSHYLQAGVCGARHFVHECGHCKLFMLW